MIIFPQDPLLKKILKRGETQEDQYLQIVSDIIKNIKKNGDKALIDYTKKFDNYDIDEIRPMTETKIDEIAKKADQSFIKYITQAKQRVQEFHEKQLEKNWYYYDEDLMLGQKITPIENVGVYVPGGTAAYPSSVIMNVIPAKVANVKNITMVNPAPQGYINPEVIAAAKIAGVSSIYNIGGAQAIAALAYGTESIPKADKIVGPGNIYVALAKKLVFGAVDIDMIAGPSEILIIADATCNPEWVAADMLGQAEHDELASAVAIVTDKKIAEKIQEALHKQLNNLSRQSIAKKSINNYSAIIVADTLSQACDIANDIAPEHLELCVEAPLELLKQIKNAGSIFLGHYSPEAAGDYFAGPNHVLPTGATAKFFSPLGVYDFIKRSGVIYYTKNELEKHKDAIVEIAKAEQLTAHANSVEIRLK